MKRLFILLFSAFLALSISVSAFAATQRATNRVNVTTESNTTATIGTSLSMEADETAAATKPYR